MKKCCGCKISKKIEDFFKNKSRLDGLSSYCKECDKKSILKFKKENPEKINEYTRKWRNKNPNFYKTYWLANREKLLKYQKEYRKLNPFKNKDYKRDNPEKIRIIKNKSRKKKKKK